MTLSELNSYGIHIDKHGFIKAKNWFLTRDVYNDIKKYRKLLAKLENKVYTTLQAENSEMDGRVAFQKVLTLIDPEMDHCHSANTDIYYGMYSRAKMEDKVFIKISDMSHKWKSGQNEIYFTYNTVKLSAFLYTNAITPLDSIPDIVIKRVMATIAAIYIDSTVQVPKIKKVLEILDRALAIIEFGDRESFDLFDFIKKELSYSESFPSN